LASTPARSASTVAIRASSSGPKGVTAIEHRAQGRRAPDAPPAPSCIAGSRHVGRGRSRSYHERKFPASNLAAPAHSGA
jgi:hypothetical protein